ncbi:MAG: alpha/beta hydrolase [Anaerolineales bacterium]|jgi:pimeloyl-ACP methyl ester carboxylesterase
MITRAKNNGSELNYTVRGEGHPVILIHGIAASLFDWRFLIPELANNGYRGYALDLLGHGESPKPDDPEAYHFEALSRQLAEWISSLDLGQPVNLIGHSLGGSFGLDYAARYPDQVKSLILVDPYYQPKQLSPFLRAANRRPAIAEKAMRMVPQWIVTTVMSWDVKPINELSRQVRLQIAEDYKRATPHIIQITHTLPDFSQEVSEIRPKTLVVWGENDLTLNTASFPALVKQIPNATDHIIKSCGHQPHLVKPAIFNRIVLDFLAGLDGSESGKAI